jgi:glycosyltransferase involved in cell wall biosynthesis
VGDVDVPVNFVSGEEPVGVYIGRFEYLKGADTLIEVVRRCLEGGLPVRWKVYITTSGSDERMLTELGDTAEVIRDLPNVELLNRILGADFLAFPSRSEGFGMAVLECMKRGIVPIARNIPIGVPDMVKDGESGFLVDNADGMVKVIEQLCENREYLYGMKRAAFEYSCNFFDYELTGRRFVECVEKMVQRPVKLDKEFISHEPKLAEIVLPEAMYRRVRRIYRKLRGGKKAIE